MIDLHCHTIYSDGDQTLEELLRAARDSDISALAVTDHDTLRGSRYAKLLAPEYEVEVLGGVEVSSFDKKTGRKIHILVYEPEETKEFLSLLADTRGKRENAGLSMYEKLRELYPVTLEQVLRRADKSESLYKQHLMLCLLDMGYAGEIYGQLFHDLFDRGKPCWDEIDYPDFRDIMPILKRTNGAIVLAHPSTYQSMDALREMARDKMIDGIELYHPRNTREDMVEIEQMGMEYDLVLTGGTDFHGRNTSHPVPLGSFSTETEQYDALQTILRARGRL